MASRRTGIMAAAVIAISAILLIGVPKVLRSLHFFSVRQVEVVGAHYLEPPRIVSRLHLSSHASVWDALPPIQRAAAAIPGVREARVERRLPATLRVTIREAVPIALVATDSRLMLIDSLGRLLPFDPMRSPMSLPVAPRDASVARLLGVVRSTDPELYDLVQSASRDQADVTLDTGLRDVRLRTDATTDAVRAVAAVRQYLAEHHREWRELDGRYRGWVFVQRARS